MLPSRAGASWWPLAVREGFAFHRWLWSQACVLRLRACLPACTQGKALPALLLPALPTPPLLVTHPTRPPHACPAAGKLTLLQQLLPRLLARGHRVLIFSQFVEVGLVFYRCFACRPACRRLAGGCHACILWLDATSHLPIYLNSRLLRPSAQMLDILEDFLHDFQDASGLLPKAEEDPSRAPTASGAQDRWVSKGQMEWMGGCRGGRRAGRADESGTKLRPN